MCGQRGQSKCRVDGAPLSWPAPSEGRRWPEWAVGDAGLPPSGCLPRSGVTTARASACSRPADFRPSIRHAARTQLGTRPTPSTGLLRRRGLDVPLRARNRSPSSVARQVDRRGSAGGLVWRPRRRWHGGDGQAIGGGGAATCAAAPIVAANAIGASAAARRSSGALPRTTTTRR